MTDSTRTAMAAGMAAGYLLGRSKKGKVAFAVASFAVGRKISLSPRDLLVDGLRKLCDSPQCRQLTEQVQGDLLTSGRSALKAVVDRELGGFADMLADRTRALGDRRTDGEQQEQQAQGQQEQQGQGQGQQEQREQQGRQPQQRHQAEQAGQEEQARQGRQAGQEQSQGSESSSQSDAAAEAVDEPSSPQAPERRRPSREPLEPRRPAPRRPARPRPSARARGGESR